MLSNEEKAQLRRREGLLYGTDRVPISRSQRPMMRKVIRAALMVLGLAAFFVFVILWVTVGG